LEADRQRSELGLRSIENDVTARDDQIQKLIKEKKAIEEQKATLQQDLHTTDEKVAQATRQRAKLEQQLDGVSCRFPTLKINYFKKI
jgi:uncharacterized protein YlxW (UPF0749 family)